MDDLLESADLAIYEVQTSAPGPQAPRRHPMGGTDRVRPPREGPHPDQDAALVFSWRPAGLDLRVASCRGSEIVGSPA